MLRIPQSCVHTRSTPFWNKETAPAGIFQRHLDKGTRQGSTLVCQYIKGR